jgi:hypothetical protein
MFIYQLVSPDVSDWSASFFVVLGALPRNPVVDKLWKGQLYN